MRSEVWRNRLAGWPPAWPLLFAGISALALALALISQYVFALPPCELCIWQRYPYAAVIALGVIGALLSGHSRARRATLALSVLAFLTGAAIAGFHVGVEQGWWEGLPGCQVPGIEAGMTVAELRAVIEAREQVVPCDEPAWTFLGVSMAGYNMLASLALAGGAAWTAARSRG